MKECMSKFSIIGEKKMQVLTNSEKIITATDVIKLYENVGWWEEREQEEINLMLQHGIYVGVWENDVLVGFARAVTDGIFRAYIEDVIIHPSFQKGGYGQKLVARLLEELSHIDIISLFCEKEYIPFYEKNEFKLVKSQYVMHRMKS